MRLSLTPSKTKGQPYVHKIEVKDAERSRLAGAEPGKELQCGKWKRAGKGRITVDIQKYLEEE